MHSFILELPQTCKFYSLEHPEESSKFEHLSGLFTYAAIKKLVHTFQ